MMIEKYHFIMVIITMIVVIMAVLSHYEGLRFFTNWMSDSKLRPRLRIVAMIYGLLLLHTIEIWIFGTTYWLVSGDIGFGTLAGQSELIYIYDYVYFSATVYSTLGFGDIIPGGPLRLLVGIESVTGLLMITWSASFTYLEMIQYWRKGN
jgi:hypothetical protein